jgi:hypothetical protein
VFAVGYSFSGNGFCEFTVRRREPLAAGVPLAMGRRVNARTNSLELSPMTVSRQSPVDSTIRLSRPPRRGGRAKLSVVIISTGDANALAKALTRLTPRCRELDAELLIIRASDEAVQPTGTQSLTRVRFISAPVDAAPSELRVLGMREASGDIVTIHDDHDLSDIRWLSAFRRQLVEAPTYSAIAVSGGSGSVADAPAPIPQH